MSRPACGSAWMDVSIVAIGTFKKSKPSHPKLATWGITQGQKACADG